MSKFHQEQLKQPPSSFIDSINAIMEIIVAVDDVSKVILFGSCSRGTQIDNSDIDLLILLNIESSGMPFNKLEEKVGILIYEQFDMNNKKPVDLLFADEQVFANSTHPDSVYSHIKRDGDKNRNVK